MRSPASTVLSVFLALVQAQVAFAAAGLPDGLWLQEGYGRLIEVNNGAVSNYQVTAATCVAGDDSDEEFLAGATSGAIDVIPASKAGETGNELVLAPIDGNVYRFRQIETMPARCESPLSGTDTRANLDVFWHTFDENYAFFAERGVDWKSAADHHTASAKPGTLFDTLVDMVRPLGDPHITIDAPHRAFRGSAYALADQEDRLWRLVRRKYLQGNYVTQLEWLSHGWLDDRTAYLRIRAMAAFSLYERAGPLEELPRLDAAMERIVEDVAEAERLVIDLRYNSGGEDLLARRIAEYFTDQPRHAYSKAARVGDEHSEPVRFRIEPAGEKVFKRPIVVLVNGATVSAAEIFLLCMEALPHVRFVGESSAGAYSDMLGKRLPNGWTFWLSNEVYFNHQGQVYEGRGQPPDIEAPLAREDLEAGRDVALETAMALED